MNACDGWALAGGPWITPEMSMQEVVTTDAGRRRRQTIRGQTGPADDAATTTTAILPSWPVRPSRAPASRPRSSSPKPRRISPASTRRRWSRARTQTREFVRGGLDSVRIRRTLYLPVDPDVARSAYGVSASPGGSAGQRRRQDVSLARPAQADAVSRLAGRGHGLHARHPGHDRTVLPLRLRSVRHAAAVREP